MPVMIIVWGLLAILAGFVAWHLHRELPSGADDDTRENWRRGRNIEYGALVAVAVFVVLAAWELRTHLAVQTQMELLRQIMPRR